MKRLFLLILLLIPLFGGSLSVEKLLKLTYSTGIWGEYTAVLVHWLAGEKAIAEENAGADETPAPQFRTLPAALTSTGCTAIPFYGSGIPDRLFLLQIKKTLYLLPSIPLTAQQSFAGPDPAAGFRIFMEVVERSV